MEKSNPAFGGADLPATTGGDSPDAAPPVRKPVASFGQTGGGAPPAGGTDRGVTLNVRCRVTIGNGAAALGGADIGGQHIGGADVGGQHVGGADIGGQHIGGGDVGGRDLVVEFEGSASLNGGAATFGGADIGGSRIGGPDVGGKGGGGRRRLSAPRTYGADKVEGG